MEERAKSVLNQFPEDIDGEPHSQKFINKKCTVSVTLTCGEDRIEAIKSYVKKYLG